MKKNKNELVLTLNGTKQELIDYLINYRDGQDYVKVSSHADYEVCLELTWRQHSALFVEYYYLANVSEGKLKGKIVRADAGRQRLTVKLILVIIGYILLGLLSIFGIPFAITYAISCNFVLSSIIGLLPLIFFVLIFSLHDSINYHRKNIRQLIENFNNRKKDK